MTHENTDYSEVLRKHGYRVTMPRMIVLDAVCAHKGHATIGDVQGIVHDMDPTIDRSTIYRALDVLVEVGLVVESDLGHTGKVYSIAGEANHHHLMCIQCGKVLSISADMVATLKQRIRETYDFELQADHLTLNGLCAECQEKKATT